MLERIVYPLIVASFLGSATPVYATPQNSPKQGEEESEYASPPQPDQPAPGGAYYIDPERRKRKKGQKTTDVQPPTPAQPAYVQPAPEIPEERRSYGRDWALLGGGLVVAVLGAALATSETCSQDARTNWQKECSPNAGTYSGYIMIAGGAGMSLLGLLGLLK